MIFDIVRALGLSVLIHALFLLTGKMVVAAPQFAIAPTRAIEESLPADSKPQEMDVSLINTSMEVVQGYIVIPAKAGIHNKNNLEMDPRFRGDDRKIHHKVVIKPRQILKSSGQVKVEAKPDYIQNPPPPYPELARQMHQEGIVMLSVDVDSQGDPVGVEIIQSSGFRMLDQAALNAVGKWKFQAGNIGNIPVESIVKIPIRFRIEK